jgi:hypothetical protein
MNQPNPSDGAPPAPGEKPTGLQALLNGVVVLPAVVIPVAAITVLVMLGYIGLRVVRDGGLMPRPTNLDVYACQGFPAPFALAFRHGMDVVQLRVGETFLYGEIVNNHITWEEAPKVRATLGFAAPTDIVYDDAHRLRLIDPNQTAPVERVCERME